MPWSYFLFTMGKENRKKPTLRNPCLVTYTLNLRHMKLHPYILLFFLSLIACHAAVAQTETKSYKNADSTGVYTFADKGPEFPGGDIAMIKFIEQHVQYPASERKSGKEGKVFVR